MAITHCPRCWSEVPRGRGRCPSCGASIDSTAPGPAPTVGWSETLTYTIHVDDLSQVADRRALVAYLLGSGRFPDRQALADRLSRLPSQLLDGLTLGESTEIKSNLVRLGAQVRAVRSGAATSAPSTSGDSPLGPTRKLGRARRGVTVHAVRGWTWAAAAVVIAVLLAGIWRLAHEFQQRSATYRARRTQLEEDARAPLVQVARLGHERPTGEALRAEALAELERGHAEFNAGRIPSAIERYQSARALDPENPDARHATRDAWIALGETALVEIALDDARAAFRSALAADPDSPRAIRGAGRADLLSGDLEGARHEFDRLLTLHGADLEAHAWAAEVYHSLGELERAAHEYRAAAGGTADPRLTERLALVERERKALVEPTTRLRTVWLDDVPRGTRLLLEDALERALADVVSRLGAKPDLPLRVVLDPSQPFAMRGQLRCSWQMSRLLGPRLAAGDLDATRGVEDWLPVFRHELAHAVVRELSGGRAPAWFEEGVAERLTWLDGAPPVPRAATRPAPLDGLRWPFSSLPPERWDGAFAGADAGIERLFQHGGLAGLAPTLAALARGADFDAALEAGYHVHVRDLAPPAGG